ncbi:ComEA family DNA-binding protein [Bowmanella dokdonensis]|uniref:Uncharacterized protein n=1 Tax=Bowmanella dokdonensis TaxID=751969 RepID=A0A939DPR9_9ALTE|nr:hypothetical protein [Bowmanella dokdonensis]MBN7826122.1 hypothetical protein [Bowmanella dokdonensis]
MKIILLPLLLGLTLVPADKLQAAQSPEHVTPTLLILEKYRGDKPPPEQQQGSLMLQLADVSPLTQAIEAQLNSPFGRLIRQLDGLAAQIAGNQESCAALQGKTLLYLSDEDGGYARQGFWYRPANDEAVFCDALFVDMTVSEQDLQNGSFLEVFAHEMGHVYLRRLMGPQPAAPSSRFHNVFAVTDYQTAFDEGFGIYFQALAAVLSRHPGLQARSEGRLAASGADHWFSRLDGQYRLDGVMHNLFAFKTLPNPDFSGLAAYQQEGISPAVGYQLKNAQAMLSSEGLLATLFYRLSTAPGLSALNPDDADWQENAVKHHTRLFRALAGLSWSNQTNPPYTALLQVLQSSDPDFAAAAIGSFLQTTYASPVDPALTSDLQMMIQAGSLGQMQEFLPLYRRTTEALQVLTDQIVKGEKSLTGALGRPIWLLQPDILIPQAPWSNAQVPLAVNLNMAGAAELALLNLFDNRLVTNLLEERTKQGPFADLAEVQKRLSLPPSLLAELERLQQLHRQSGRRHRE